MALPLSVSNQFRIGYFRFLTYSILSALPHEKTHWDVMTDGIQIPGVLLKVWELRKNCVMDKSYLLLELHQPVHLSEERF